MHERAATGRTGEELAASHLQRQGYRILDRNVRSRLGEIDIIAMDGTCYVFVEVRTRRSAAMTPEESVTRRKQRRMANLGMLYLQSHGKENEPWRADVVAIELGVDGQATRLEHYVNAVEE
ncbi:MAG: putative endonuclease [Chloroflexota bacterium]|jgi:putative endonuclease|nr:putative endonuclease [Chloroflexota bacterium]